MSKSIKRLLEEINAALPITGGHGDGHSYEEFDKINVALGIAVEMEHTEDCMIALKIAVDHLSENKNYYIIMKDTDLWHKEEPKNYVKEFIKVKTGLDIMTLLQTYTNI